MRLTALSPNDPRIARPLFSLYEAAGYLDMPYSTLRSWAKPDSGTPLITLRDGRLPFIGFAEAFVLKAAKAAGVPASRIRPNVEAIQRDELFSGIDHALANQRIWTDGAELLLQRDDDSDLEVPRNRQKQMSATVKDQLRLLTYADDGFARRIQLPNYGRAVVTVDPLVASGRPLLADSGARVKDLVDRYRSGDPEKEIAEAFHVSRAELADVIRHAAAA